VLFLSPEASRPAGGWPARPTADDRPRPDARAAGRADLAGETARDEDTPLYPLVFIGPMASGKSKIGRRVARSLRVPFIDTDKEIEAGHGPITEIFAQYGEGRFRALERAAVAAALQRQRVIVSLGGGAVLDQDTRADLRRATVISLSTTADAVRNRTRNAKRPLLAAGPDAWQRIYDERRPIYDGLASITFDTSTRPVDAIAADIVKWVREQS
jgi:shikimate kinase